MKSFVSLILLCFFIIPSSNAQIFGKISKSIDNAIDNAVNDAVDKTVGSLAEKMMEKVIEKIFSGEAVSQDSFPGVMDAGSSSDSTSSSNPSFDLGSIFGGGVDKTKVYDFSHKMKMEIKSNDEEPQIFDYYFNTSSNSIGMEIQSMFVILDIDNDKTYAITNGSLISMNLKSIVDKMTPEGTSDEGMTITKTGRSETIHGFLCEEYTFESEDGNGDMWVTQEFVNQSIQKTAFIQDYVDKQNNVLVTGAFLKYKFIAKDNGDIVTMDVIDFRAENKTIDFSDY